MLTYLISLTPTLFGGGQSPNMERVVTLKKDILCLAMLIANLLSAGDLTKGFVYN